MLDYIKEQVIKKRIYFLAYPEERRHALELLSKCEELEQFLWLAVDYDGEVYLYQDTPSCFLDTYGEVCWNSKNEITTTLLYAGHVRSTTPFGSHNQCELQHVAIPLERVHLQDLIECQNFSE